MKKREENGFTLIELLAVIIILGILMIIAVPSVTDTLELSNVSVPLLEIPVELVTVTSEFSSVSVPLLAKYLSIFRK